MKNKSIWQEYKMKYSYPKLTKDIKVDILIIGGGLTGLNIFYKLKSDKRSIVLVDKSKIGQGISARSSAKITYLQEDIYSKLTNTFDISKAKLYYDATIESMNEYRKVISKENIECDFEKVKSYLWVYNEKDREKVKKEEQILTMWGNYNKTKNAINNSLYTYQGFDSYVIHPLKYIDNLSKISITSNHQIYENTNIINIIKNNNEYLCFTDNVKIQAKLVIIASHYPNFLFPYLFPFKCYLEKSSIGAFKSPNLGYSAINMSNPTYSLRFFHDYALKVGLSHNLCWDNNDLENLDKLTSNQINYAWTNYDIMTLDNLPLIGFIKENLIIATGYNTWGLTGSMLASIIIKDLANNKENKYQEMVNPKRGFNKNKLINYPINIFSNTYAFLNSKLIKNKKYYHNNPIFKKINNDNVAIYKDKNKEYIVYNKCPHLGCSLVFNELEKTWDCPCHGSRFSLDGKCILGPSNYDISYRK